MTLWKEKVRGHFSLKEKTTCGLDGSTTYWAEVESVEDLFFLLEECRRRRLPWRVLGGGSNLLVTEEELPGLTLKLNPRRFSGLVPEGDICHVGAAFVTSLFAKTLARWKRPLSLVLGGIPGSLGGALAMNAGAGASLGDFVLQATGFDAAGRFRFWSREEMEFSYRDSLFKREGGIVLSLLLDMKAPQDWVPESFKKQVAQKLTGQPYAAKSAGCIFKNPPGKSAGKLIDASGLKGLRVGNVAVSETHANFIVNLGRGRFEDFRMLIQKIQDRVLKEKGIFLETEVVFWKKD
jgi:UDP-N-acetylmuramate dehydrogenase